MESVKQPKLTRASKAYGYLVGQEISLELIKKQFPKFEMSALKAQATFNSTFNTAKNGLKAYLLEQMGLQEFAKYDETLSLKMNELLQAQKYTEEVASNFINEVEKRADGHIPSPILETLLHFEFYDRPYDEFLYGFTTTFKTGGHPKSKNTNWQIKIPKSWRAEEGDRPNVIQKFVADYGSGDQVILLLVKELPSGKSFSKSDIDLSLTESVMRGAIPQGGKFISFTKMKIDNLPGGLLIYEQTTQRLDMNLKLRMLSFVFIRGSKYYTVQCSILSDELNSDLELIMKKNMPLYKLIANSIVITDQYN